MALISCPNCKGEVSNKASKCQKCSYDIDQHFLNLEFEQRRLRENLLLQQKEKKDQEALERKLRHILTISYKILQDVKTVSNLADIESSILSAQTNIDYYKKQIESINIDYLLNSFEQAYKTLAFTCSECGSFLNVPICSNCGFNSRASIEIIISQFLYAYDSKNGNDWYRKGGSLSALFFSRERGNSHPLLEGIGLWENTEELHAYLKNSLYNHINNYFTRTHKELNKLQEALVSLTLKQQAHNHFLTTASLSKELFSLEKYSTSIISRYHREQLCPRCGYSTLSRKTHSERVKYLEIEHHEIFEVDLRWSTSTPKERYDDYYQYHCSHCFYSTSKVATFMESALLEELKLYTGINPYESVKKQFISEVSKIEPFVFLMTTENPISLGNDVKPSFFNKWGIFVVISLIALCLILFFNWDLS